MRLATEHLPGRTAGALPFVLVHGWCCNREAMRPVAAAFPERDRLLLDLPGHGASPPAQDLSIPAHAAAVLREAPARFLAVGHSMGGQVALAMAASAPERVAGAVLLDPAHLLASDRAIAAGARLGAHLAARPPSDIIAAFARDQLFAPLAPEAAARFEQLVASMAATPAQTARRQWECVLAWNADGGAAAALAGLQVPVLAITAARSVNRLSDLARASGHVTTGQVAAAGHMVQFEAMPQVEAMVRRWLALNDPA
ncbi:MAG: alpha/beta fold hydrolase [Sphingomonadaceae bacterium]